MNKLKAITTLFIILITTSCSHSDNTNDSNITYTDMNSTIINSKNIIEVQECSNTLDENLTLIETGDILISSDINSSVEIFHHQDDTKFVCSRTGKAYIDRGEW